MKKFIYRTIFTIVIFLVALIYADITKFINLHKPWFLMEYSSIFLCLIVLLIITAYCYKLINNKNIVSYYLMLALNAILLINNSFKFTIILLYVLLVVSAVVTRRFYLKKPSAGYLSLLYLFFIGYLLVAFQITLIVN